MGIPRRICRLEIELSRFGVNVRIVNATTREGNSRPLIDVVVLLRESELEFEYTVGVRTPPDEDNAVEVSEIVEGWDQVNAAGGVIFEMLVFDGDLVIAEGLFAFGFGGDGTQDWGAGGAGYPRGRGRGRGPETGGVGSGRLAGSASIGAGRSRRTWGRYRLR